MPKYILLILLFLKTSLFAQVLSEQTVKININTYSSNYPQERAYIQFDKPAYSAGETIWFKAYLMKWQETSNLSKTFYVDFTDDAGNLLLHGVYPVWDASASGNFDVPATYKSNSLHIHAYTKWMLNFDSSFLYNKDIRIIPKPSLTTKPFEKPILLASVQFFPEGGDLVAGIKSKVAFKANYQNGLPASITGVVTDSKGEIMDSIKTLHDGMGYVNIDAASGETYTAKWVDEHGTPHQTLLPAVKPFGATLKIMSGHNKTGFVVNWSDSVPTNLKTLHIVATMQQKAVFSTTVNLGISPVTGGSLPVAEFPSGILQVTLLDSNWSPLAERITFVNNNDYSFQPSVTFDTVGTGKHGKNIMMIDVPDSMESNLSVSVTDAGVGTDSTDDILSHLLFTGDLKGRVYHPAYYFSNSSDSVAANLDLVMLTNGWRRFKWDDVIAAKAPQIKYQCDSNYLNFSGHVQGATPKQIQEAGMLLAAISPIDKDSSRQYITVPLDSNGSFSKPDFLFFDTVKITYRFLGKSGSKLANHAEVVFNSGAMPQAHRAFVDRNNYVFTDTTGDYYNGMMAAKLQQLLKETTLQNVMVKTKSKSKIDILDERYATGIFKRGDASQFDLVNVPIPAYAYNLYRYLMSQHVPGLVVAGAATKHPYVRWNGQTPAFFLNELSITRDMEEIMRNLTIQEIAYIKVFPGPFFSDGHLNPGGAVAVYTKKGKDAPSSVGFEMLTKLITGYTQAKEFYTPDYDSTLTMQQDARTTLYWNPLILTDSSNHQIKLRFYNNDVSHQFRVVLEGVNADGRLTRVEKLVK